MQHDVAVLEKVTYYLRKEHRQKVDVLVHVHLAKDRVSFGDGWRYNTQTYLWVATVLALDDTAAVGVDTRVATS